jgi:hypothetical protein
MLQPRPQQLKTLRKYIANVMVMRTTTIQLHFHSILYLFTYLLNSPKANYKVTISKRKKTHTKQDNFYHLDNNKNK